MNGWASWRVNRVSGQKRRLLSCPVTEVVTIGKLLSLFVTSCTGPKYHVISERSCVVWKILDGAVMTAVNSFLKIGPEVSWKRTPREGSHLWEWKLGSSSCKPGPQREDTLNLAR